MTRRTADVGRCLFETLALRALGAQSSGRRLRVSCFYSILVRVAPRCEIGSACAIKRYRVGHIANEAQGDDVLQGRALQEIPYESCLLLKSSNFTA